MAPRDPGRGQGGGRDPQGARHQRGEVQEERQAAQQVGKWACVLNNLRLKALNI